MSRSRRELVNSVVGEILAGRPVVTLAGQQGIGKTTMLQAIAADFRANRVLVAWVDGTRCNRDELHRQISFTLGQPFTESLDPREILRALLNYRYRTELVVLLNEADLLSAAMFRYLCVLLDLFNCLETNLHFVLVGATGSWDGLRQLDIEAFEKIAPDAIVIPALRPNEAKAYLEQSLRPQPGCSPQAVMSGWRTRSLLKEVQGNPAAIEAALTSWRAQVGSVSPRTGAPGRKVPISAWVSGAAALALMAAALLTVHAPSRESGSVSIRLPGQPTAPELANNGWVDTFSAAIATATNNPASSGAD